jgi:hypothetical protein
MSFNQISHVPHGSLRSVGSKTNEPAIDQIENAPSYRAGDASSLDLEKKVTITDPVFGEISENGPNYRNVRIYHYRKFRRSTSYEHVTDATQLGWVGASILMIKTQVGIGVLSIPKAFAILGFVPGIITLVIVAGITTWVSDHGTSAV